MNLINNKNGENEGKQRLDKINKSLRNLFGNNKEVTKKNKNENKRGKYSEIDNMQQRLEKGMEKIRSLNETCQNMKDDVEKFVQEEISSEFVVYLSNTGAINTNENQNMK